MDERPGRPAYLPGEHEAERPEGDGEGSEPGDEDVHPVVEETASPDGLLGVPVTDTGTGEQERATEDGRGEGDYGDHRCAGAQGEARAAQAGDGQQRGGANPGQPGPLALQAFLSPEARRRIPRLLSLETRRRN